LLKWLLDGDDTLQYDPVTRKRDLTTLLFTFIFSFALSFVCDFTGVLLGGLIVYIGFNWLQRHESNIK
jgi:hypothetical protein